MQDGNPEFVQVNITDNAFQQLRINLVAFVQPDGKIVAAKMVDLEALRAVPLSAGLGQLLADPQARAVILQNGTTASRLSGVVLLPENPLLIAARPILTSDGAGPIRGTLVFGRYLDRAAVTQLAETTHLTLSAQRSDAVPLPDDYRRLAQNMTAAERLWVQPVDDQSIRGYARVQDIFGKDALFLRIDEPRAIYRQGRETIEYFMLWAAGLSLLGTVITQILLDRLVLSRRVYRESEERYRAVLEQAAEGIFLFDPQSGAVLEANAAFRQLTGYADETRLKLDDIFVVSSEEARAITRRVQSAKICAIGEQRVRRGDGNLLDTESSASVITFGGREVVCAVMRDITERKRAEAERARLFEQEQMRRQELDTLYTLSCELADAADFEQILQLVTLHAVNQILTTFALIGLIEGDELIIRAAYPLRVLEQDLGLGRRAPLAQLPACTRALSTHAPVIIQRGDAQLTSLECEILAIDLAQSVCLAPLRVGERSMGLLLLGEARHPARERFTPEKIRLAHSIGDQAASALRRAELFAELERTYLQTVLALARTVDAKDTYTADHADRLAEMAQSIGSALGMQGHELEDLRYGAILHDIGKIGVADAILQKPARLNDDEWSKMRQHPEIGAQILSPVRRLAGAAKIVRHHHERWDGCGYPDRLAGTAIPLGARILAVVDSFSAITDKRVYKAARPHQEAFAELEKNSGTQFDPQIVRVFLKLNQNELNGSL